MMTRTALSLFTAFLYLTGTAPLTAQEQAQDALDEMHEEEQQDVRDEETSRWDEPPSEDMPEFPVRTDMPPIGRFDPAGWYETENLHKGAGTVMKQQLLSPDDMETDHGGVTLYHLPPGSSIGEHYHGAWEEMYISLNGPAVYALNGKKALLPQRSMVLCSLGDSHGIANMNDIPIWVLSIAAGPKASRGTTIDYGRDLTDGENDTPPPFTWTLMDPALLGKGSRAHEGKGLVRSRRIWPPDAFKTKWYVTTHAIVDPGSSIGYHQHNTREEVYIVLEGEGRYTANDSTFTARVGDVLPCRLHGAHGIYNDTEAPLELLIFSVAEDKHNVRYDYDLHDDLTGR